MSTEDMILTRDDFNVFVSECRYWQRRFGLTDWEVHYVFGMPSDDCDVIGATNSDYESRRATIYLNAVIDSDDAKIERGELVKLTAQHEMMEVMLSPLQVLAQKRSWDIKTYNSEVHCVIHRISTALKECARDVLREAIEVKQKGKSK
jgi:hypothetical protein